MAGMTPSKKVRKGDTPQAYTPRSGSRLPGQVRRALGGHIESAQRNGDTLEVSTEGRLEVKIAPGSGLVMTPQGLMIDPKEVGDKNRPPVDKVDVPATVTAAALHAWATTLVAELKRTGRMR
jgi:hypothetical protein